MTLNLTDRQTVALWGAGLVAAFAASTIGLALDGGDPALDITLVYYLWLYLTIQACVGVVLLALAYVTPKGEDPLLRRRGYRPPVGN